MCYIIPVAHWVSFEQTKRNKVIHLNLKGKKINFLGDSITEGVGTSGAPNRYIDLIASMCGASCRNYGISGSRIAVQRVPSANPQFDLYFASRVEEMDEDADVVVVFGGTNDFGHGDAPIGNMRDRTPDTFYGALHDLYTRLIQRYPEKLVVIATPLHRWNENNPRGDCKPDDVGTLGEYVKIIRQVAEYYSLPLLDLYAMSGLQPCLAVHREMYVPDGLHPNDAGHQILAQKFIKFLEDC